MQKHDFTSIDQFRGRALPFITTHSDLVHRQRSALDAKKKAKSGLANDADWSGDKFVEEAASMVAN